MKVLVVGKNFTPYDKSSGVKALEKMLCSLPCQLDFFSLYRYGDVNECYEYRNLTVYLNRKSYPTKEAEIQGWKDAELMHLEGCNLAYIKGTLKVLDELISRRKYDLIISVCFPIQAHYVASIESKKFNIDWIAWYIEPYYSNWMYKSSEKDDRLKTEIEVLKGCKRIITLPSFSKEYDSLGNQVSIELPFIEDFSKVKKENAITLDKNHISLIYAGDVYKIYREPDYLFRLMTNMNQDNIKLYFVGDMKGYEPDEVQKYIDELASNTIFINRQDDAVVNDLMFQADYLVNIGNTIDNQLPGKVLSLISTGKPIINICKSNDCPSLRVFRQYPCVLNLFETNSVEDSIEKLKFFLKGTKKTISWSEIKKIYSDITSDVIVNLFYRTISEMHE